jgi:hypothetical protein
MHTDEWLSAVLPNFDGASDLGLAISLHCIQGRVQQEQSRHNAELA